MLISPNQYVQLRKQRFIFRVFFFIWGAVIPYIFDHMLAVFVYSLKWWPMVYCCYLCLIILVQRYTGFDSFVSASLFWLAVLIFVSISSVVIFVSRIARCVCVCVFISRIVGCSLYSDRPLLFVHPDRPLLLCFLQTTDDIDTNIRTASQNNEAETKESKPV
jgi:hypothetical protein